MGHNEDRELVPLKPDFDVVWRGYRRSQVQFYVQQTDTELRLLAEDRDSALSQVENLSGQLDRARAEIDELRQQLDDVCRTPIDSSALSDRLRRMIRLAEAEAEEIVSSARAKAEHEWARAEQQANELRARYERMVADADEWRRQWEEQRREELERTRAEIEEMARDAEQRRRRLDADAEERRTQVEEDFEIAMAARREEAMRTLAERDEFSRREAERRIREATEEANRRTKRADRQVETMRRLRQHIAEQVRGAQEALSGAELFLAASVEGTETAEADSYVDRHVREGLGAGETEDVSVPEQRAAEQDEVAGEAAELNARAG